MVHAVLALETRPCIYRNSDQRTALSFSRVRFPIGKGPQCPGRVRNELCWWAERRWKRFVGLCFRRTEREAVGEAVDEPLVSREYVVYW